MDMPVYRNPGIGCEKYGECGKRKVERVGWGRCFKAMEVSKPACQFHQFIAEHGQVFVVDEFGDLFVLVFLYGKHPARG